MRSSRSKSAWGSKNKFIKVQTLTPLKCESNQLFNSEKELFTEHITNYENCQGQSVIFTPSTGRGEVKNNKKFVNDSVYLFYNVTTIDPYFHTI